MVTTRHISVDEERPEWKNLTQLIQSKKSRDLLIWNLLYKTKGAEKKIKVHGWCCQCSHGVQSFVDGFVLSAIVLHCSYTENKVIALAGNYVQREGKKFNSYFILYSLTLNIYIFTLHINGSYALPQSAQKEAEEVTRFHMQL